MSTEKSGPSFKSIKRLLGSKGQDDQLVDDSGGEAESGSTGKGSIGTAKIRTAIGLPSSDVDEASYLVDETPLMDRKRRLIVQEFLRQQAKVNARNHNESDLQKPAPEGELQNSIQQHPWLDAQRFDGVDPNLNPEPPLNTAARREFDNERREQEMEKQLRLGNMPKFTTAPKPGQR